MKKYLPFLLICFFLKFNVIRAQQFDLITEMFKNSDTVVLRKEYYNWSNIKMDKEKIIEDWDFQSILGGPDSKIFKKAFDVEKFEYQGQEKFIDFEKLPANFYSLNDYKRLTDRGSKIKFSIISLPIFNSKNHWAIIYHQLIWPLGAGGESLFIYRKNCEGDWIKYYTITLSFS